MAWAWTATIAGALLMGGSIVPSLASGQRVGGIVLGDAEIVPIFGMVIFVAGLLVLIQEWSGLS